MWHPYLVKDIEKLECVQKFALRLCVKQWDLDYTNLLFICDLPTLAARRKYIQCIYKIINNLMFFPHDQVFVPRVTPLQPAANFLFHQPFHTQVHFNTPLCQTPAILGTHSPSLQDLPTHCLHSNLHFAYIIILVVTIYSHHVLALCYRSCVICIYKIKNLHYIT